MNKAPRAVIFDMDGTLIDSERLLIDTWRITAEKHGFDYLHFVEVLKLCIGLRNDETSKVFEREYGPEFDYRAYGEETIEIFLQRVLDGEAGIKPGAFYILEGLRLRGVPIALGTSTRTVRVEPRVRVSGMEGYFDAVVCGDMVSRSKPEPDIFLKAAERLGVSPEKCLVVEDSNAGAEAAFRAGMRVILVPDVLEPSPKNKERAERVCEDLFGAADHIFGLLDGE
ncbi:MAG: HAD family phosphatase [Firmicutes bacterium]|nr:HAD family phosphatase [Bacillota bacterium]